jgi:lysozyme family protein
MPSVQQIAQEIVAREGGFVDHPNDPGGATNFGVTIGTMRRLGIDLDGNGLVDTRDVKRLTRAQAVDIFIRFYWELPGINRLPEALQPSVFDMQVNAGANAVKILQRMVSEMGFSATADGVIGPNTLRAVQAAHDAAPDHIADAYAIARRNYYFRLADRNPRLRVFARARSGGKGGWIRRAEEFMHPRYRLTEAQFQRRVASWAG